MENRRAHSNPSHGRRRFIGDTFRLIAWAGILSSFDESCKERSNKPTHPDAVEKKSRSTTHATKRSRSRSKGMQEKLVMNTKTNVLHLPTSLTYAYYDEIKSTRSINIPEWENEVQGQARLNKGKSGNILEVLSLQKIRGDVNNDSLGMATDTLARAFGKEGENSKGVNHNITNYRLHELMLQFVALNNNIPSPNKWQAFNEKVVKPQKLGRRQKWMETEMAFSDRIKYIQDREASYKKRLKDRASKYPFT